MHDEQMVSPFCGIDRYLTYSSYGQSEGKNKNENRKEEKELEREESVFVLI